MKVYPRGLAALMAVASVLTATLAQAQDKTVLATEREKISYMIGADVGRSIGPAAADLDLAAFERAIRNAFAGGKPLLAEAEARTVGQALMQRVDARTGKPAPGKTPGAPPPVVAKDKVGYLVGADVGRSLAPIKDEIEFAVFAQGLRTLLANGKPLLTEAEMNTLRQGFVQRMQVRMQAQAAQAAGKNAAEGAAFLATNKTVKGVFTTPSGLQYMVLRQGNGKRPLPTDRVRVSYQGTLLDGTVFDSSYERGQPAEFALNQVITGWTEGLGLMPIGAKYRFWIPGSIAYGDKGMPQGGIGPNATLVFDVELLGIL